MHIKYHSIVCYSFFSASLAVSLCECLMSFTNSFTLSPASWILSLIICKKWKFLKIPSLRRSILYLRRHHLSKMLLKILFLRFPIVFQLYHGFQLNGQLLLFRLLFPVANVKPTKAEIALINTMEFVYLNFESETIVTSMITFQIRTLVQCSFEIYFQ